MLNYEALMREIKEDIYIKVETYHYHGLENSILSFLLWIDLHVRCDPNQNPSSPFCRSQQADSKIYVEKANKIELPKQFWEEKKKLEDSHYLILRLT